MLLESFLPSGDQEETNDDGSDRAEEDNMTQLSPFSQHQECIKCNQLYIVQQTDHKWNSICKKCYAQLNLSEQREELIAHVSLKCCNGNCEQEQYDPCSNCKKSYCFEHSNGNHDCEVQSVDDMALKDDKTVKNVEVTKTIIEEADMTGNPIINEEEKIIDEAEQFRGLFPDRQSFLSSFLKTLTKETPGNCGYNNLLFYLF